MTTLWTILEFIVIPVGVVLFIALDLAILFGITLLIAPVVRWLTDRL